MNTLKKLAVITTSLIGAGALTACQSNTTPNEVQKSQQFKAEHSQRFSPEKREEMRQLKAERKQVFEQIRNICEGKKVGTAVEVKAGEKTIPGTCAIRFEADRKDLRQMKSAKQGDAEKQTKEVQKPSRPMPNDFSHRHPAEPLTDARRAELVKNYDQRLIQRQVKEQAFAQACQNQTSNKVIQLKVGEQTINGQCKVYFQPNQPAAKSL